MNKTKVAFLESRLLSSQSEQSKKFSKSSDWLEKAGPPKKCGGIEPVLTFLGQGEVNFS